MFVDKLISAVSPSLYIPVSTSRFREYSSYDSTALEGSGHFLNADWSTDPGPLSHWLEAGAEDLKIFSRCF